MARNFKRTDVHRPSAISPADYDYVTSFYFGPGEWAPAVNRGPFILKAAHMAKTGGTVSEHAQSGRAGSCQVCGANAFYLGFFYHKPSNAYLYVGEECAVQLDQGQIPALRKTVHKLREALAGKKKAKDILVQEGLLQAWEYLYDPSAEFADEGPMVAYNKQPKIVQESWAFTTCRDIVGKLVKYGSISEKQMELLRKLVAEIPTLVEKHEAREAEKAAKLAKAEDCPLGRIVITGKVLTVKVVEGYGYNSPDVLKMLVEDDRGFKVWSTVPVSIDAQKGDRITFSGEVKKHGKNRETGQDDRKFGIVSRPTKAEILEKAGE